MRVWSVAMGIPAALAKVALPELQKYIREPPGKGFGVVYVQLSPSKKMYVGKHAHGITGKPFCQTREDKTKGRNKECRLIYRAFRKYGRERMQSFIIWHGKEEALDDAEAFHISEEGLDTLAKKGYNIFGGKGQPTSETHREACRKREVKMKADPVRAKHKADALRKINTGRKLTPEHKKKIAEKWEALKSDPVRIAALSTTRSENARALYNDGERRAKLLEKRAEKMSDPTKAAQLSANQSAAQARIRADSERYNSRREAHQESMRKQQLLKDAKKYIHLMAECASDEECIAILRKYDKVVSERERINALRLRDRTEALSAEEKKKNARARKSTATAAAQAKIKADSERYIAIRNSQKQSMQNGQLVKDAKKYIHLMAQCDSDEQCVAILRKYEKLVATREKKNARRASKGKK